MYRWDAAGNPSCAQCREAQALANDVRDCAKCSKPELLPANVNAYNIYNVVQSQLIIAGMGGVVAVNQLAIWKLIEAYEKSGRLYPNEDTLILFEKIIYICQLFVADLNKE